MGNVGLSALFSRPSSLSANSFQQSNAVCSSETFSTSETNSKSEATSNVSTRNFSVPNNGCSSISGSPAFVNERINYRVVRFATYVQLFAQTGLLSTNLKIPKRLAKAFVLRKGTDKVTE